MTLLSPVPCPSLGSGYNFNRAHRRTGEANMRRAFIILLTSATLGISLPSTTPASAAPERFCAKWLYGASLQREAWGGASYKYERIRCLKWVSLDIPQPNRFVRSSVSGCTNACNLQNGRSYFLGRKPANFRCFKIPGDLGAKSAGVFRC